MRGMSASSSSLGDIGLETAEVVLFASTASTSNKVGEELPLGSMNQLMASVAWVNVRT